MAQPVVHDVGTEAEHTDLQLPSLGSRLAGAQPVRDLPWLGAFEELLNREEFTI